MGYNSEAVEYYGYIPDGGEWVLADADGNVLDSVDGAEVAEVSNYQTFTASKPGTYYVKFLIDETLYSSVDDNSVKITNADLSSTPMLKVNVTETGKDHTCSAGPVEALRESHLHRARRRSLLLHRMRQTDGCQGDRPT